MVRWETVRKESRVQLVICTNPILPLLPISLLLLIQP